LQKTEALPYPYKIREVLSHGLIEYLVAIGINGGKYWMKLGVFFSPPRPSRERGLITKPTNNSQ